MAITNNYTNNVQNNYQQVIVQPTPIADPEDLIWSVGPTAPTYNGGVGTVFTTITPDNVIPSVWYHGGNPIIDTNTLSFFGDGLISATTTTLNTISGQRNKGLNEIRLGNTQTLASVTTSTLTTFVTSTPHGFTDGDLIYISGIAAIPQATGYWFVDFVSTTSFRLRGYTGGGNAVLQGNVQTAKYLWDEVYTTPLGSYSVIADGNPIGIGEFLFTNDNSNECKVNITDPNIVPQAGDSFLIQKRFNGLQAGTSALTTDGINSQENHFYSETYTFKITGVTSVQYPLLGYVEYTFTLDKSFAPNTFVNENYYDLVLLNRTGIGINKSLLTDTWQPKEVHREQLLGDPYNYVGVLQPAGQKNYLYYKGSKFLGVSAMLDGIIKNTKTPYIVLDFEDEIKDRINYTTGDVEVHLPNVMIQGEVVPSILSNTNPSNNVVPYFTETNGVNKYAPLYLKNGSDNSKIYGYVFFDLRIIVIDEPELATAIGYASKRNFTLPVLNFPDSSNTIKNSTPDNPLTIVGAGLSGITTKITTSTNHNFKNGDFVTVIEVQGNTQANTPANIYYYVDVVSNNEFRIWQDAGFTAAVVPNGSYIPGTGKCYGAKLAYEYFITYRLKGPHYKSLPYAEVIPFNFVTSGVIDNTPTGQITLSLPQLTHLVDNTVNIGFEADEWEVIIGKYTPDVDNIYKVVGFEDVAYLESQALTLFTGPSQGLHSMTITKAQYDADLITFPYEIKTSDPIFNTLTLLPDTLFISEIEWFTGNIIYREHAEQYRMKFTFNIPSNKWNGTTNPTFEAGNPFMDSKLITELGFFVDSDTSRDNKPFIYGKISPPIKKDNASALTIEVSIDF